MTFDSSSLGTVSTATWNHTIAEPNEILFVSVFATDTSGISAAKFNNVSMSTLASDTSEANGATFVFYLVNPDVGTHTVSITTLSPVYRGATASYKRGRPNSVPDSFSTSNGGNPLSLSTTVVASGCWVLGLGGVRKTGVANDPIIASNKTDRQADVLDSTASFCICDSNGVVQPGSQSITFTSTPAGTRNYCIVWSVAPALEGGFFLRMI